MLFRRTLHQQFPATADPRIAINTAMPRVPLFSCKIPFSPSMHRARQLQDTLVYLPAETSVVNKISAMDSS